MSDRVRDVRSSRDDLGISARRDVGQRCGRVITLIRELHVDDETDHADQEQSDESEKRADDLSLHEPHIMVSPRARYRQDLRCEP